MPISPDHLQVSIGNTEWTRNLDHSIEPTKSLRIPKLLKDQGLAVTLQEYIELGGCSEKILMFQALDIIGHVTEALYGFRQPTPHVTPLTHKLYQDYCQNNGTIPPQKSRALTKLFERKIAISTTRAFTLRHAEHHIGAVDQNTGADSFPGVTNPREGLVHTKRLLEYFRSTLNWPPDDPNREVSINVQTHADPPPMTIKKREDHRFDFESGSPPVGFTVTTSENGEKITVKVCYGDNRAAQEIPSITDRYEFTFVSPRNGHKPLLSHPLLIKPGYREGIVLDRKGELVENILLPVDMQTGLIPLQHSEITHIATVAGVAAYLFGHDIKLEGSLNSQERLEVNQLSEFTPPAEDNLSKYSPRYFGLGEIYTPQDARKVMGQVNSNQINLPPTVSLKASIKDSTQMAETILAISQELQKKISEADSSHKELWLKFTLLGEGSGETHRAKPLIEQSGIPALMRPQIPSIQPGDTIILEPGRDPKTIWVRNEELSGSFETDYVVAPEHCAVCPDISKVGPKVYNLREVISRLNIRTMPYAVATERFFLKTLQENGVLNIWSELDSIPTEKEFVESCTEIASSLTRIPLALWHSLATNIQRQVPDWANLEFATRSTNPMEDMMDKTTLTNLAGALETHLSLQLRPSVNTLEGTTDHPTNVAGGVLRVMASAFKPSLARFIYRLGERSQETKRKYLVNWKMPVMVSQLAYSIVSGTSDAKDLSGGSSDIITVIAQPGLAGGVDENGRPKLIAKMDFQTLKLVSPLQLQLSTGQDPIDVSWQQLSNYFPPELTESMLLAIAKNTQLIKDFFNLGNNEWGIARNNTRDDPRLYFFQTR